MTTDSSMAKAGPASTGAQWQRIGLGALSQVVPPHLVDEAVAATGKTQQRVRLLPARLVVLFVLALTLWSPQGYRQVWRQLTSGWPGLSRITPTTTAFSGARDRVGPEPLLWLFDQVCGPRGTPDMPTVFRFGLRLVAWDGTKLHLDNSDANAAAFGRDRGGTGGAREGGYPRVWLLTLFECGTGAVIAATPGPGSEVALARQLVDQLTPGMLHLADRNFFSYDLWSAAATTGANLLWRVKSDRLLPVVKPLPDGSWLSTINPPAHRRGHPPLTVRVIEYTSTVTTTSPDGRTQTRIERFRLLTTLLDPQQALASELADCYHERWAAETGYQNLKTRLRGPRVVLRSANPDGVRQEIYAYLICYQAIRHLIVRTAAEHGLDPDLLSFTTCLHAVRRHMINTAIDTADQLAAALTRLADELLEDQLHPRRSRSAPRAVKRPTSGYRGKRPTEPATTTATYTFTISPGQQESA